MGMIVSQFIVSNNFKWKSHHINIYMYRVMAGISEHTFIKKNLLDNQLHEFSTQSQHFRGIASPLLGKVSLLGHNTVDTQGIKSVCPALSSLYVV
jgi:hypothetical protein